MVFIMNDKTKTYRWLPWAVATGLAIVIGWILTFLPTNWISIVPWQNATEVTNIKAINEFGNGVVDVDPYWNERIKAVTGIIVFFVIGPSLWIFSEIKNQYKTGKDTLKKGFTWYAGSILVIGSLLLFVPGAVTQSLIYNNAIQSTAKGKNANELRIQLAAISFEAAEIYFLPEDKGGAGGNFTIPEENGQTRPISLEDISYRGSFTDNTFVLEPAESDSIITIYGIGHQPGNDTEFTNVNGEKGKLQLSVKVVPNENNILRFKNDNY